MCLKECNLVAKNIAVVNRAIARVTNADVIRDSKKLEETGGLEAEGP